MDDAYDASDEARPWDGFLPPEVRPLDATELSRFAGKRILITGAGGYLGSALAMALAPLTHQPLTLLDQAEYGLYRLEQELKAPARPRVIVGSVLDRPLLTEIFARDAPQMVLHAAALKHVPLMEENPLAAAETNVLGTETLLEAAVHAGVERFLLLSTDKAVDPINVMGATKLIAEQRVLCAGGDGTGIFTVARLCNVLGSTGSVAPLFARQIALGGPVTLTHVEATRFFLSRRDAVRFLLRAAIAPTRSGLVVPCLTKPYRVQNLAQYLMRQAGGHEDVAVIETGLRVGDKLHEQLVSREESARVTADGMLLEVQAQADCARLAEAMHSIRSAVRARDTQRLVQALQRVSPGYAGPAMYQPKREDA